MTFAADLALANPKIYVDPQLYEVAESEAVPVANRRVDQTLFFLRFMQVNDAKLIRYGHNTSSNGPDATVLNLASSTTVGSAVPYDIDTPGITFQLSHLAGRVTISNLPKTRSIPMSTRSNSSWRRRRMPFAQFLGRLRKKSFWATLPRERWVYGGQVRTSHRQFFVPP